MKYVKLFLLLFLPISIFAKSSEQEKYTSNKEDTQQVTDAKSEVVVQRWWNRPYRSPHRYRPGWWYNENQRPWWNRYWGGRYGRRR